MAASSLSVRAALLLALTKGPNYGLALIEAIDELTNGHIKLQQAAVYPVLRKMEADGLLTSYESDPLPERGGRPRRYYELTALGAKQAAAEHQALFRLLQSTAEGFVPGEVVHA